MADRIPADVDSDPQALADLDAIIAAAFERDYGIAPGAEPAWRVFSRQSV